MRGLQAHISWKNRFRSINGTEIINIYPLSSRYLKNLSKGLFQKLASVNQRATAIRRHWKRFHNKTRMQNQYLQQSE